MLDPIDPNTVISLAMDPTRKDPKAWKSCPRRCSGLSDGITSTGPDENCPTCGGSGVVAVDWGKDVLRAIWWAYENRERGAADDAMGQLRESMLINMTLDEACGYSRDIIAKALLQETGA